VLFYFVELDLVYICWEIR